jgi:DNA-binding NtrC family response regulator
MRMVFALLDRAAASSSTILVEGETGTGKEATVRSIHEASARRGGPYVIVDCGAIPGHLLESELFGHEKGAFTGAVDRRIGAFEAADGGTIFLDEIGELPLELQPKLLRVLESRHVRRVGSAQHRDLDFRVVAATNRDLRQEVNAGRFRADLYYRLGVVRIRLPPLRERPEDVAILAQHILDRLDAPVEDKAPFTTPEFIARLSAGAWTGNVRELRNFLEQCVVLRHELAVTTDDVPDGDGDGDGGARDRALVVDVGKPYAEERRRALDAFEAAYVAGVLEAHGNNVSRAARAAGLGRVYFYELLRRHRIR